MEVGFSCLGAARKKLLGGDLVLSVSVNFDIVIPDSSFSLYDKQ
jgi:hypothetical protein